MAEERIKQVFTMARQKKNESIRAFATVIQLEKLVLQILADCSLKEHLQVDKEKWDELLKLHKELRRNFELLVRYSSKRNIILSSIRIHKLRGPIEKIENKLEGIEK